MEHDTSKPKPVRGGFRPGAGRKKGRKSNATIERDLVKKHFEERVLRATDALIDAQISLARGQTFLYKIEKEWIKTGETKSGKENGYWRSKKPIIVTTQSELERYLEGLVEEGDMDDNQDPGATYYFLTTKEPNNMAIDSLHNRVHGKPRESLEIGVNVKFSLKELMDRRKMIEARDVDTLPGDTSSEEIDTP